MQQELARTIQDLKSLTTMQQLTSDLSTYATNQNLYWAYRYSKYLTTPAQLMIIQAISLGNTRDLDGSAFMRQYQTNVALPSLLDPSNRFAQQYVKVIQLFQLGNVLPTLVDFSGTETDDVVFDIQLILGGMTDNYRGSSDQDIRDAADAAGSWRRTRSCATTSSSPRALQPRMPASAPGTHWRHKSKAL